jgi:hypothetical protein
VSELHLRRKLTFHKLTFHAYGCGLMPVKRPNDEPPPRYQ